MLVDKGGLARSQEELVPSGEKIQSALLRFMIRCLAGELNHNEALKTYISPSKEDIWDEDVLQNDTQLYNFNERLSSTVKLSSIHSAYLFIQDWNTRQQQMLRPVGPVMEEAKHEKNSGGMGGGPAISIIVPTTSYKPQPKKDGAAKNSELSNKLLQKKKDKARVMS